MTFDPNNRPPCANPNCNNLAMIGVGRKLYCGKCAMEIMEIKNNKEEAYIKEALENGNKK